MGNMEEADTFFGKAMKVAEDLKLDDLYRKMNKERLEMQGKHEQARNPYFWDNTTGT
jgi:hypothetical protein